MARVRRERTLSRWASIGIGLTAFVVLGVGTTVAGIDARQRHHCAVRGDSGLPEFPSLVKQPGRFVGLSESAAKALAKAEGYTSRVTCRDGRDILSTLDFRRNRINFGVHHGRVVGYWLA